MTPSESFERSAREAGGAADELVRLRAELQGARAAAAGQMRFLAEVCHDLRQPLHALSLISARLARLNQDAALQPAVLHMQAGVAALDASFTELLDLASLEIGGRPAQLQRCELAPLFERLRLSFGTPAFDKGLALGLRGTRHAVWADPLMLERLLGNLLANAVRHTEDGGVLLACRARGTQRLLQVWDSGCGMPPGQLGRIFEAFYQLPRRPGEADLPGRGVGLGLAIAQRLALAMGSTLSVASQPGRGSVFSLSLRAPQAGTGAT